MTKVRNSNPCDGCTIRRVKCETQRPCAECRERGIECTVLRTRKKRGPKGGPRAATRSRVEEYQRSLQNTSIGEASASRGLRGSSSGADRACGGSDELQEVPSSRQKGRSSSPAQDSERRRSRDRQRSSSPERIPIHAYRRVLLVYRKRAYSIWPVIRANDLLARLERDELDYESYALAAACCAATIANLRLPEHGCGADSNGAASSGHPSGDRFVREALRMRERYDYRESASLAAALTAFFIHIHYVNLSPAKPRSASHYLREAITFVHLLRLGEPELEGHRNWNSDERSLRVLVYWLILLSER
jgi:hypothetical protein